jgi:hypothetical protein
MGVENSEPPFNESTPYTTGDRLTAEEKPERIDLTMYVQLPPVRFSCNLLFAFIVNFLPLNTLNT